MNNAFLKLKEKMIAVVAKFSQKEAQDKAKDIDAWINPKFRCSMCKCEGVHKDKEEK